MNREYIRTLYAYNAWANQQVLDGAAQLGPEQLTMKVAYPLWQMMLHQVNHATQHRSEVAVIWTQFGHSPGALDLLHDLDITNQKQNVGTG